MMEVIFYYEGNNISIQCNKNEKKKDIIEKFLTKIEKNGNDNVHFLYNGNTINYESIFMEQANNIDKNRNQMNIKVNIIKRKI